MAEKAVFVGSSRSAARIGVVGLVFLTFFLQLGCGGETPSDPGGSSDPPPETQLCATIQSGTEVVSSEYELRLFIGRADGAESIGDPSYVHGDQLCFGYVPPQGDDWIAYLVASGSQDPSQAQRQIVGVLGFGDFPQVVTLNALTTVAASYAMAQFTHLDGSETSIYGPTTGLRNAAQMATNLADVTTGSWPVGLTAYPNGVGEGSFTWSAFNTLANLINACVSDTSYCDEVFPLATPPGGSEPADTWQAMVQIARNPENNAHQLLGLTANPWVNAYQPVLDPEAPPENWGAWTIALRFVGDGSSMNGPGNMAVDPDGRVWTTNNYTFPEQGVEYVCGSQALLCFEPDGSYCSNTPMVGGGLYGAGFGIDFDPYGSVWVGNFGFHTPACGPEKSQIQYPYETLTQVWADGTFASPGDGWYDASISYPQGTISDATGNIWVANCGDASVSVLSQGDINQVTTYKDEFGGELDKPFDLLATDDKIYLTGNASNDVWEIDRSATPPTFTRIGAGEFDRPMAIVHDAAGNLWVSNSKVMDPPCNDQGDLSQSENGFLTRITPEGELIPTADGVGGLSIPWGMAVDGSGDLWIVNFDGQRLSHFHGADDPEQIGTPVSENGYYFDGLVRNTGGVIDPSGNVWVANNWQLGPPDLLNPGGYEMVVFVGMASPVQRPPFIVRPQS